MATLNGIDLTENSVWSNEFEGSAIQSTEATTEDGRKIIYQKYSQKYRKLVYDCTNAGLTYADAKAFEQLRDSGTVVDLVHEDGRVFTVILDKLEAEPYFDYSEMYDTDEFMMTLYLTEV